MGVLDVERDLDVLPVVLPPHSGIGTIPALGAEQCTQRERRTRRVSFRVCRWLTGRTPRYSHVSDAKGSRTRGNEAGGPWAVRPCRLPSLNAERRCLITQTLQAVVYPRRVCGRRAFGQLYVCSSCVFVILGGPPSRAASTGSGMTENGYPLALLQVPSPPVVHAIERKAGARHRWMTHRRWWYGFTRLGIDLRHS